MNLWVWIGFLAFVLVMVALDPGVFHRKARVMRIPEALAWTAGWVVLSLAFNVFIYFLYENNWGGGASVVTEHLTGQQAAIQFFMGYLLEKSLSIDNIFVIAMIFAFFRVPLSEQHRVLFWGILGAVVLRAAMIAIGAALIERFDWIVYVFGGLLILSAVKMLVIRHDNRSRFRSARQASGHPDGSPPTSRGATRSATGSSDGLYESVKYTVKNRRPGDSRGLRQWRPFPKP